MNIAIRTLYLYAFAMLGLIFVAIGGVRLLDMGLRATIFKQADAFERFDQPPMPMMTRMTPDNISNDTAFTPQEREQLRMALRDYEQWQQRRSRIDPVVARRQREAASSLAMILIGLPIYLYHWILIRREAQARRRRNAAAAV